MMTEAMKNEVFAFAKEVRVNKTKLMELVERVVSMVEVQKPSKVEARTAELVSKLKEAVKTAPFTTSAVPPLTKDTHYLLRTLEAKGFVKRVGKVDKPGRGRKDYLYMLTDAS